MAADVDSPAYQWIGWVGLLPILMVIRFLTPARAFLSGVVWAVCFWMALYSLGTVSLTRSFMTIAATLFLPALYMYAGALLTWRIGFQPLFLAFGWIMLEYGFFMAGVRHWFLGNVQATGGVVHLIGDACGCLFVAFLIVLANAGILCIITGICVRVFAWKSLQYLCCANSRSLTIVLGFYSLVTARSYRPRAPPITAPDYQRK